MLDRETRECKVTLLASLNAAFGLFSDVITANHNSRLAYVNHAVMFDVSGRLEKTGFGFLGGI